MEGLSSAVARRMNSASCHARGVCNRRASRKSGSAARAAPIRFVRGRRTATIAIAGDGDLRRLDAT
jgi:hypothetical protein